MFFTDYAKLVQIDKDCNLNLNDEDLNKAEYILFIGIEGVDISDLDDEDVIGMSENPVNKGDKYENPWDHNTYLEVVAVDKDLGRAMLLLREI